MLHSSQQKKKCRVNYNQNKDFNIIIFGTKYELFLPPYQITFFLVFGQAKIFFSYQILMNILISLFRYCFQTKKSLNNIRYRKTSQNKKRLCFNKIYFNGVRKITPQSIPPGEFPPGSRLGFGLGLGKGEFTGGKLTREEFSPIFYIARIC